MPKGEIPLAVRVFAEFWKIKETCAFGWESVGASFFVCAALAANAALARLDPSEVGKGSETRDDEKEERCGECGFAQIFRGRGKR